MRIEGNAPVYIEKHGVEHDFMEMPARENKDQDVVEFLFGEHQLMEAIETSNEKLRPYNNKLEFSIHEKTRDVMIKVVDSTTNEVIREIPPKKIIDMIASMLEKAGLLVDKRA